MTAIDNLAKDVMAAGLTGIDRNIAASKWNLARHIAETLDRAASAGERTVKSEELGAQIGAALGRKPYSGSWVRQQAAAYRRCPILPATDIECAAFLSRVNGNAAKNRTRTV